MKSILKLSVFSILLFSVACNNAPAGEEAKTEAATPVADAAKPTPGSKAFTVNSKSSKVAWKATKLIGGGHDGSITVSDGTVHVENADIVAGSFTIDMNSLTVLDLEDANDKSDLESHLKSDDFFDVANHGTAKFVITEATPGSASNNGRQSITGNLTIKGITNSIQFFAKVLTTENSVTATTGSFVIDRTAWDVKYRSGTLGTAKDKIINDKVALNIMLVATSN
jgi:polyisoprenoid-binding protein YceI